MNATSAIARGPLIIVSGPSGSGKTTLIKRLLAMTMRPLRHSVSATTRAPRPGETDGVEYWFWDRPRFEAAIAAGELLEHAVVHGRDYYGTLKSEVEPYRARGFGVILDIDVQGAEQVRAKIPDHVSVFITAADPEDYARRLRSRGADSPAAIARRMETARAELARAGEYRHQIRNDDLETAAAELAAVIDQAFETGVQ
ncbi:MAG: guanylate kinase [Gemmataceae bacterium]|nr:guanylate kinase [Gemmataceae bacterium]